MSYYVFIGELGKNSQRAMSAGKAFSYAAHYDFPTETAKDSFVASCTNRKTFSIVAHGSSADFKLMRSLPDDHEGRGVDVEDRLFELVAQLSL